MSKCPLYYAFNLISKRWSILILLELYKGKNKWKRFHEIKNNIPKITSRILSFRLKELEKEKLIIKKVDKSEFPIKSEYSLTRKGKHLIKILSSLKKWISEYDKGFCNTEFCIRKNCKNCTLI